MRYIAAITKGNAITEIYKNEQNFLAFSVNEEKALAMGSAKEVISVLDGKNKISGLHLELMNARASYIYPQHEGFNYVRKTAHALKNGDDEAIESAARVMAQNLKDRSEEHTSELQSRFDLVCRLLLEKKNNKIFLMI